MTSGSGGRGRGRPGDELGSGELERYRVELTGYCYRMLGSPYDAEDAVQEVLLRAWRGRTSYDGTRASVRMWLYRIATNHCLDVLKAANRRELASGLGPPASAGVGLGTALPEQRWVLPVADTRVVPPDSDPADQVVLRESIRLAFVAALQLLPPRQRAIVVLRDVLGYPATEVAGLLATSVPAVTSALQRARATLARRIPVADPLTPRAEQLLARYCAAFEADDIDALVELVHEDGTFSMPPWPWWLRGRAAIATVLRAAGSPCAGSRLVPVRANGTTAVAQYRPAADGRLRPFAVTVLDWRDDRLIGQTTFLGDPARLFAGFGLGDEFTAPASYTLV